ncbi:MAG: DUF4190 domain-containing protein [Firmicutes bacterium]|nr:DUF4190 domain-containing protein [Bacillota bacterium]
MTENNPVVPGKNAAIASMVLGIISIVLWFFGFTAIISVILGIIGLILAGKSKKAGYHDGIRTAGFVLSLIGLIGGAVFFVSCVACTALFHQTASNIDLSNINFNDLDLNDLDLNDIDLTDLDLTDIDSPPLTGN